MIAQEFVRTFVWKEAPEGSARYAANKVKEKYGHNEMFSWMLSKWNQFANYDANTGLYGAMAAAGVRDADQKRIINTYSSNSKDKSLGEEFRYVSGGFFGVGGYNSYAKQFFKG